MQAAGGWQPDVPVSLEGWLESLGDGHGARPEWPDRLPSTGLGPFDGHGGPAVTAVSEPSFVHKRVPQQEHGSSFTHNTPSRNMASPPMHGVDGMIAQQHAPQHQGNSQQDTLDALPPLGLVAPGYVSGVHSPQCMQMGQQLYRGGTSQSTPQPNQTDSMQGQGQEDQRRQLNSIQGRQYEPAAQDSQPSRGVPSASWQSTQGHLQFPDSRQQQQQQQQKHQQQQEHEQQQQQHAPPSVQQSSARPPENPNVNDYISQVMLEAMASDGIPEEFDFSSGALKQQVLTQQHLQREGQQLPPQQSAGTSQYSPQSTGLLPDRQPQSLQQVHCSFQQGLPHCQRPSSSPPQQAGLQASQAQGGLPESQPLALHVQQSQLQPRCLTLSAAEFQQSPQHEPPLLRPPAAASSLMPPVPVPGTASVGDMRTSSPTNTVPRDLASQAVSLSTEQGNLAGTRKGRARTSRLGTASGSIASSGSVGSGGSIGGSGTTRAQGVQKRARCSKGCAAAAVAAAEVGAGEGADSHASARHAAVKTEAGDEDNLETDATPAGLARKQRLLQEKNRRAQARFRERQKDKLESFEAQIEELNKRVRGLEVQRAELASRNEVLKRVVSLKDNMHPVSPVQASTQASAQAESAAVADEYQCWIDTMYGPAGASKPGGNAARMGHISVEDFCTNYKDMVREVGQLLLVRGDEQEGTDAHKRLLVIAAANRQLVVNMYVKTPKAIRAVAAGLYTEPLTRHGPPDASHWRQVLTEMRLTKAQQVAALQSRATLLQRMGRLMSARREVISLLTAAMPTAQDDRNNAVGFTKATQASEQLRSNLQDESDAVTSFLLTWHSHILTPMQEVKMYVQAYPWVPDAIAMGNTLAEDNGEPAAGVDMVDWMAGMQDGGGRPFHGNPAPGFATTTPAFA